MRVASLYGDSGGGGRSAETREGASCTSAHEFHKSDTRQGFPFCRRLNEGERHGALSTVRGFAGYEPIASLVNFVTGKDIESHGFDSHDFRDRRQLCPKDQRLAQGGAGH